MTTNKATIDEFVTRIKNNTPLVYEKGKTEGVEEGLDMAIAVQEAFLADKPQSHYDAFWDAYQQNGTRTNYTNGFGLSWVKACFKPKYDMKPDNAYMMFRYMPLEKGDFVELLDKLGVELDFSNSTNMQYCFYGARMSRLGVIDIRKATGAACDNFIASMPNLVTIDLIKVSADNSCNWLTSCPLLKNVTFEGEIAKNFNIQWSTKLSKASIESIINILSTTTEGLTVTLSQTAVDNAFETVKDAGDGSTSVEWIALAGNETIEGIRPNWTISLV